MQGTRKFEVHGEDEHGDIWIVASDTYETINEIAESFRKRGYRNVKIIEELDDSNA